MGRTRKVCRSEPIYLRPAFTNLIENIYRAFLGVGIGRTNNQATAIESNCRTEIISLSGAGAFHLVFQSPGFLTRILLEDECGTAMIVLGRPNHGRVAINIHAGAELGSRQGLGNGVGFIVPFRTSLAEVEQLACSAGTHHEMTSVDDGQTMAKLIYIVITAQSGLESTVFIQVGFVFAGLANNFVISCIV